MRSANYLIRKYRLAVLHPRERNRIISRYYPDAACTHAFSLKIVVGERVDATAS